MTIEKNEIFERMVAKMKSYLDVNITIDVEKICDYK